VIEAEVLIRNRSGLHVRAAGQFVRTATKFESNVLLSRDDLEVNGKSIMGVIMLAAEEGTVLRLKVEGPDEQAAMDAITELVDRKFGEDT
jgi:phosphocarrier protein HPr